MVEERKLVICNPKREKVKIALYEVNYMMKSAEDEMIGGFKAPPKPKREMPRPVRRARPVERKQEEPSSKQEKKQEKALQQEPLAKRCEREMAWVERTIGDLSRSQIDAERRGRIIAELKKLREYLVSLRDFNAELEKVRTKGQPQKIDQVIGYLDEALEAAMKMKNAITSYANMLTKDMEDLDRYEARYGRKLNAAFNLYDDIVFRTLAFEETYSKGMDAFDEIEAAVKKYFRDPVERDMKLGYIRQQRKEFEAAFSALRNGNFNDSFERYEDGYRIKNGSKLMQLINSEFLANSYLIAFDEITKKIAMGEEEINPEKLRFLIETGKAAHNARRDSITNNTKVMATKKDGSLQIDAQGKPEMRNLLTDGEMEILIRGAKRGGNITETNPRSLAYAWSFLEQAERMLNEGLRPRVTTEQVRESLGEILKPGVTKEQVRKVLSGLIIYDTVKIGVTTEQIKKALSGLIKLDATIEQIQQAFDNMLKPDLAYFEKNYAKGIRRSLYKASTVMNEADAEKAKMIGERMRNYKFSNEFRGILASDRTPMDKFTDLWMSTAERYGRDVAEGTATATLFLAGATGVLTIPAALVYAGVHGTYLGIDINEEYKQTGQVSAGSVASGALLAASLVTTLGLGVISRRSATKLIERRLAGEVERITAEAEKESIRGWLGPKYVSARTKAREATLRDIGVPAEKIGTPLTTRTKAEYQRRLEEWFQKERAPAMREAAKAKLDTWVRIREELGRLPAEELRIIDELPKNVKTFILESEQNLGRMSMLAQRIRAINAARDVTGKMPYGLDYTKDPMLLHRMEVVDIQRIVRKTIDQALIYKKPIGGR